MWGGDKRRQRNGLAKGDSLKGDTVSGERGKLRSYRGKEERQERDKHKETLKKKGKKRYRGGKRGKEKVKRGDGG